MPLMDDDDEEDASNAEAGKEMRELDDGTVDDQDDGDDAEEVERIQSVLRLPSMVPLPYLVVKEMVAREAYSRFVEAVGTSEKPKKPLWPNKYSLY